MFLSCNQINVKMKKHIFLILTCLVISGTTFAQRNVVKINPLGLAFGSTELGYEGVTSNNLTYEISIAYVSDKQDLNGVKDVKSSGIGVEGKLKFYLLKSKEAPRGLYAAPVITFDYLNPKPKGDQERFTVLKGGALLGYQWVFGGSDSGFALDVNLGAQYTSTALVDTIGDGPSSGILIRSGVSLGYAW